MKKAQGFASFEFYFVMSIIGIIALIAIQRYTQVAEETKRLSFDVLAKHFQAAVLNYHSRWIMVQQQTKTFPLPIDGLDVQFTAEGWPIDIGVGEQLSPVASASSCLRLWENLLQNSPPISYEGGEPYGSYAYHVRFSLENGCRYELVTENPGEFYFEYSPVSGEVLFHMPPITKNN
jgi:MSHA pilin protein MshB